MALNLVVEKLEEIEEPLRSLYLEKDGKFHLDVSGLPPPEDNRTLLNTLSKERKAREALEKKIKSWDRLGKTDTEIEELIAKHNELEEQQKQREAENKGEWDKLRQQMNEKHAGEIKKLQDLIAAKDKEITTLHGQLESQVIEYNAVSAIAGEKGIPQLLLPAVKRFIRVQSENGAPQIQVVDDKGEPRVNGKGDPLSLSELVAEMRSSDIYGRAFLGTGSSGSGAQPPTGGSAPPGNIHRRSDLKSEKERAAYVDKFGLAAYTALPM